jgi:hypothetical protein
METLVVAYCFSPSLRIKRRRLTYVLLAAAKRSAPYSTSDSGPP